MKQCRYQMLVHSAQTRWDKAFVQLIAVQYSKPRLEAKINATTVQRLETRPDARTAGVSDWSAQVEIGIFKQVSQDKHGDDGQ